MELKLNDQVVISSHGKTLTVCTVEDIYRGATEDVALLSENPIVNMVPTKVKANLHITSFGIYDVYRKIPLPAKNPIHTVSVAEDIGLMEAAKPLFNYLKDKGVDPHTEVVVSVNEIKVISTVKKLNI